MKTAAITLYLLLFMLYGHSQTLVSYNKSDGIDFSKYSTYQIYDLDVKNVPEFEPKESGLNLLIEEISKQMNARGYLKVEENPDLIINLGVAIAIQVISRQTDIHDAPMFIGQRNYHWESEEIEVHKYNEGTVTLDLVDASKNEMIWQAISSGTLSKKREKNRKKIVKAVKKLFKKYPIKSKTN